jgi:hypothetical protein
LENEIAFNNVSVQVLEIFGFALALLEKMKTLAILL